jgi:DNA-binding beta-propeller fold protein YncE
MELNTTEVSPSGRARHQCAATTGGCCLTVIFSRRPGGAAKRSSAAFSLASAGLLLTAASALAVTGQLTQLPGTTGCVSQTGTQGMCADGKALDAADSVAVTADGKSVYVASISSSAVAVFGRDTTTGVLTQLAGTAGCVSEFGPGENCAVGKALNGAFSVAVSPDGESVYVASSNSDAVAVFRRDTTTGELTQLPGTAGCVSETGSDGACTDGKALRTPHSVAVSADGTNVYVTSVGGVAAFQRNAATGELTQLAGMAGCVRNGAAGACRAGKALDQPVSVAVSADGKSVYVASIGSDAVALLRRNTTSGALFQPKDTTGCVSETGSAGACADGKALADASGVAVSADGKNVYVASYSGGVAVFRRNTTSGALAQLVGPTGIAGCVSGTGSGGQCSVGKALGGARRLTFSPAGANVYVASIGSDAVAVFRRDPTSGVLSQLGGTAGCVSETGAGPCADGKALAETASVAVSPDGRSVYIGAADSDAVAVFARETLP